MGSPPKELLERFQKYATHMEFNFPVIQEGSGFTKQLTHVTPEGVDLIHKLLIYNPDNRITAS